MAYSDPEPEVIGRKLFIATVVSALVFATAAWVLVS